MGSMYRQPEGNLPARLTPHLAKVLRPVLSSMAFLPFLLHGCESRGTRPSKPDRERFQRSSQYNAARSEFRNEQHQVVEEMWQHSSTWDYLMKFHFGEFEDGTPKGKLPEIKPDLASFLEAGATAKTIWLGHSSLLINMEGNVILVDPMLSVSFPYRLLANRFQDPILALPDLPEVDFVLISHDHFDHLDMDSVKHFVDRRAQFVVPLGVGSHLQGWGIPEDRVIEKDWWESARFGNLEFIATPAQHFSGRYLSGYKTLWASWVIRTEHIRLYYSGDSGYGPHFHRIGARYGPFDIAFLECGQYDEDWSKIHMLPEESVVAFKELRARKYFPVHWGMFQTAFHSWHDPIERIHRLSKQHSFDLLTPKIGQIVDLKKDFVNERWWETL